jgi:nucleoside 2-deoxyribosyltransferase
MKIMVCGSIGYSGGADDIRNMYSLLEGKGFSIVNHTVQSKGMDYSGITDFRDKLYLSRQIVSYDLKYIEKTDVIVVIANGPSYGTAIEMFIAKKSGKKVILLAKDPVPTPWPINFSDYRVTNEEELIELLDQLQNQ